MSDAAEVTWGNSVHLMSNKDKKDRNIDTRRTPRGIDVVYASLASVPSSTRDRFPNLELGKATEAGVLLASFTRLSRVSFVHRQRRDCIPAGVAPKIK